MGLMVATHSDGSSNTLGYRCTLQHRLSIEQRWAKSRVGEGKQRRRVDPFDWIDKGLRRYINKPKIVESIVDDILHT